MPSSTNSEPLKIAVMGAGAVGCFYGGMLARAGHDVTLIARPAHVEAIRSRGLLMDTLSFREYVPLHASSDPAAVAGADIVLFSVKSADTCTAATAMAPHLAKSVRILSLQNGVGNAALLQQCLTQAITPVAVYVAAAMPGPGHLKHLGRGELVLPPQGLSDDQIHAFRAAGIGMAISDDIEAALWAKLIVNCVCNALSAISGLPYGPLWRGEEIPAIMRTIVDECLAITQALGIHLPNDPWPTIEHIMQTMPAQTSSTAQDLARGKRSEIGELNGMIVRKGDELGIPVPVNRTLYALTRLLEAH